MNDSTKSQNRATTRIDGHSVGALLTMSGIINQAQFAEAQKAAADTGMDICKMLSMSGYVKEKTINMAIEAYRLIMEENWERETMAQALQQAYNHGSDLRSVLSTMSSTGLARVPAPVATNTTLAEFLLESGALAPQEMAKYKATSDETGLPLGRVISHAGVIQPSMILAALSAQVYERSGHFDKKTLLTVLTNCYRMSQTFEQSLSFLKLPKPKMESQIKLGELFLNSGLLPQTSIISALEQALLNGSQIGRELVHSGQIKEDTLNNALLVQGLFNKGHLSDEHVAATLRRIELNKEKPDTALGEIAAMVLDETDFDSLDRMLSYSGITQEMTLVPLRVSLPERAPFMAYLGALVGGKVISDAAALCAARLLYLVRMDILTGDQAISLMKYCYEHKITADQSLEKLNKKHS